MQALSGLLVLLMLFAIPLIGIAIRMGLRLAYGARGPLHGSVLHATLNAISWLFILGWVFLFAIGSTAFLPVFLAIVLGAVLEYVLSQRELQRDSVWTVLTRGQQRGQDFNRLLQTQKDRFTGVVRRDLEGFLWQTDRGEPVPVAIDIWRKAFPRRARGYAALSKEGRLLYDANDNSSELTPGKDHLLFQFAYFVALFAALVGIVTFVTVAITPAIQSIFNDFALQLSPVTTVFFSLVDSAVARVVVPLIVLVFGIWMLLAFAVAMLYLLDLPVLQPLGDRLFFARHRAAVLRLLAVATEHGLPFEKALTNLAAGNPRYPANNTASRLHRAMRYAAQGADWKESLARAGLVKRNEMALLAASENAMNLPWALRALSDRILTRSWFRWEALFQTLYPLLLLLVGLFVAWFCVAMFMPLVNLISALV